MGLPSGYRRLEYIQSTGTQYIDTGFVPNQDTRVLMDIAPSATTTQWVFGSRDANYKNTYCLPIMSETKVRSDYNSGDLTKTVSSVLRRVIIDKNKNNALFGDVSFSHTYASFNSGFSLLLFSVNTGGAVNANMFKGKTYSCKIYDNGTLIRDFIPCKKPDGTIGLWDDVNSVFYGNAGTGTFTAGSVIAIAADKSEIKELEYIQSSGNQYINSGFSPNGNTAIVMDAELLPGGDYPSIFGARNGSSAKFWAYQGGNGFRFNFSATEYSISGSYYNVRSVYSIRNGTASIGENTVSLSSSSFETSYNLYLFASNASGTTTYPATMKLYSCKIYDNGTLIRNCIAAKLSDGTVGLYDKLNGLLYINAGTGTFEAGPSSLNLPVNIGGIWKKANEAFVNIGGTWKAVEAAFVNIGGAWKKIG